jgi:hypothetical protein
MDDVTKWHDPPPVPGMGEHFGLQPKTTSEHTATLATAAALGSSMNADRGATATVGMHPASAAAQPQAPAGMTPHGAPGQQPDRIAPTGATVVPRGATGSATSGPAPGAA